MVVNQDSGYGYVVGTDLNGIYAGGVYFLNLNNLQGAISEGGFADAGYSHDAQVVTYSGPDPDYQGREIFLGSNEDRLVILDVTDKQNPRTIGQITYQNTFYTHQGWFDKTQKYFIIGDELDEFNTGIKTRSLIFDLTDLDHPKLHFSYYGPTNAIDHNGYVMGDLFYLANYTAGVRVIGIDDLENKNMDEIGFFDTYPENNTTTFNGAWNVYPFFESGVIAISDINRGLFLIQKSPQ
jgi:choice-of-anchor B domain-containing protein